LTKVAVVTGAARGIGRAVALRLARGGCAIVACDIRTEEGRETAELVRQQGGQAIALSVDVRDEEQVKAMVAQALREFGGIDILVNNAGILLRAPLTETSADDFDLVVGVNLKGAFLCMKHVAPVMRERGGGVIVNIASIHAFATLPHLAAYAASKAGLVGLTKAAALDLGAWNIRVVALCPSAVDTPHAPREAKDRGNLSNDNSVEESLTHRLAPSAGRCRQCGGVVSERGSKRLDGHCPPLGCGRFRRFASSENSRVMPLRWQTPSRKALSPFAHQPTQQSEKCHPNQNAQPHPPR